MDLLLAYSFYTFFCPTSFSTMSSSRLSRPSSAVSRHRVVDVAQSTFKDAEELSNDIRQLKEKYGAVKQENVFLRTNLQRMANQMRKKDKQIQQLIAMKIADAGDTTGQSTLLNQLRALKSELMAIFRLTAKIRELEALLLKKDDELKKLKHSIKYTNLKELEVENQAYFTEAKRLKKALEKVLSQSASTASLHSSSSFSAPPSAPSSNSSRKSLIGRANEEEELRRLREENNELRKLRRFEAAKEEAGSSSMLRTLKDRMAQLQKELVHCQTQLVSLESSDSRQHSSRDQAEDVWID